MYIKTISSKGAEFPKEFTHLAQPVKQFYAAGNVDLLKGKPRLGIVGSRKATPYGRQVTTDLARTAARAGAVIVSGLALGVDSIAHQATLDAEGRTIAVLPGSLNKIYPPSHRGLAEQILARDGLLLSEFEREEQPMKHYFIQRNRLIAALSDVLLVTEAAMGSGSRHTVDFMLAGGKPICAVPGDIGKASSAGTNYLIKHGCEPILSSSDLLAVLGLNENLMKPKYRPENQQEAKILQSLAEKPLTFNELVRACRLEVSTINTHMTILEIKGAVESSINNTWRIAN